MSIGLCHLVSRLHDMCTIDSVLVPLATGLEVELGETFVNFGPDEKRETDMTIFFIKSGGVEQEFKKIFHLYREPFILLATPLHNSLPAALEILAFLRQQGLKGEILYGEGTEIADRIAVYQAIELARQNLKTTRLGVIGKPSDWLIASRSDYSLVRNRLGIELMDIPIGELDDLFEASTGEPREKHRQLYDRAFDLNEIDRSLKIYSALKAITARYELQGLTLRCFDMLDSKRSTGCLALSLLNSEGIVSGCEGDVPSLLSMVLLHTLTGLPIFMANPSRIDRSENSLVLAHCTIPLAMVGDFELATHFESGMGVALRGAPCLEDGATLFKLAPDLSSHFVTDCEIVGCLSESDLCRTQIKVKPEASVEYFLTNPLGNHHLLCGGRRAALVNRAMELL